MQFLGVSLQASVLGYSANVMPRAALTQYPTHPGSGTGAGGEGGDGLLPPSGFRPGVPPGYGPVFRYGSPSGPGGTPMSSTNPSGSIFEIGLPPTYP